MTVSRTKMIVTAVLTIGLFLTTGFVELTEARSRGGGRSFKSSPSTSKPAAKQSQQAAAQPTTPRPGGFFGSGLAGGIMGGVMGGFLGSMLFGGVAHAGGGLGGSGIGFFEILLFAGGGFFLFRWLSRRRALATGYGGGAAPDDSRSFFSGTGTSSTHRQDTQADDPLVAGVKQIWAEDESFHPDEFKEQAQDMFFKIQAGWTRRDASVLVDWVGNQLLGEYDMHFEEMKEKGEINRLENISVRKVDLIDAGVQDDEIFVVVRFTANLLDYTVEESTGRVVKGDSENPVKFEEEWTFARPVGSSQWKLEGIRT